MTSERKIAANRRNAKRSTGPKSEVGKKRVSQNALQHGLARAIELNSERAAELKALTAAFAADASHPAAINAAQEVAEAELDVRRVRDKRAVLLQRHLADGGVSELEKLSNALADVIPLDRYERRAVNKRKKALDGLFRLIDGCSPPAK